MQVDPMKPKSKPPRTKCLKLKCDRLLSTSPFKFNLRRYTESEVNADVQRMIAEELSKVGRCRLTLSKPVLKLLMVSALDATI